MGSFKNSPITVVSIGTDYLLNHLRNEPTALDANIRSKVAQLILYVVTTPFTQNGVRRADDPNDKGDLLPPHTDPAAGVELVVCSPDSWSCPCECRRF